MVDKIILSNLSNLQNETTAVGTINANNAAITTAIDNTISRDGSAPNQMGANFDMNNNRILNLPIPISTSEPATYGQLANAIIGKGGVPLGGTTGQVLNKTSNADYAVGWTGSPSLSTLSLNGSTSGTTNVIATAVASGTLTLPAATDQIVARNTTDTLTNKTLTNPTVSTGTFTSPTLVTPSLGVATATTINKVTITAPATNAVLTIPDGVTLTGPAASGTAMTLGNNETVTGVKTFGAAGNVGKLVVAGTTSGSTVVNATAAASGTLTLPAATDTLIGKATTDTLTNKTYDTAGTGNSFSINGVAATANTGTGAVVRATSPALVTPNLGTPTAAVLTSATGLPVSTGIAGLGTGVATALAVNVGTAGAPVVQNGALGTPTSGTLTNATGLPLSGLTTQAAFTFVGNNTGSTAVPTAVDISTLTTKASPAAGDFAIISDQAASGAWKKATVSSLASAGSVASFNGQTGAIVGYFPPQGRLTLQTLTPVMTTTQSAKTTIFYTPYVGDMVPLYNGTNMVPTATAEISVLTTDTTKNPAAIGASKNNDWFIWNDAGTIRISHGPDWTNDTTRSAGTALVLQNGIWLNNASITNGPAASRGTYVGTTASNASSQLDYIFGAAATTPTAGYLGVWNAYNRVNTISLTTDTTASWTYGTNTFRQPRAQATNLCTFVLGLSEDAVRADYMCRSSNTAADAYTSIGLDSTTVASGTVADAFTSSGQSASTATYVGYPSIGKHFVCPLEATFSGTSTFGTGNNASPSGNDGGFWTTVRN